MDQKLKLPASGKVDYDCRRQSVLIPFPGSKGAVLVVEVTRPQWLRIVADVEYAFDRMAYDGAVQASFHEIDAAERLTMVGEKQRGGA